VDDLLGVESPLDEFALRLPHFHEHLRAGANMLGIQQRAQQTRQPSLSRR
jgi:hypothetical protein